MPDDVRLLPSAETFPAPDALADTLAVVADGGRVVLLRDGTPVAVLVPLDDAAALEAWEDEHDARAVREARERWGRGDIPNVTMEEVLTRDGLTTTDLLREPE